MTATAFKFDKNQPRDSDGKWVDVPGGGLPDVKTFSASAAGREVWLTTPDPAKRGASLFANTYEGNRAIRQASRNLRDGKTGRDALDGVDVSPLARIWEKNRGKTKAYTREDLEADVVRGAEWLNAQQDAATPSGPLVRGMRLDPNNLPKPGDTFDGGPVSWSNTSTALNYAENPHDPNAPTNDYSRQSWTPVYVVGEGLHAADVGSQVMGRLAGEQPEWVSKDRMRVVSVEPYSRDNPQLPEPIYSYSTLNMPLVVRVEVIPDGD